MLFKADSILFKTSFFPNKAAISFIEAPAPRPVTDKRNPGITAPKPSSFVSKKDLKQSPILSASKDLGLAVKQKAL